MQYAHKTVASDLSASWNMWGEAPVWARAVPQTCAWGSSYLLPPPISSRPLPPFGDLQESPVPIQPHLSSELLITEPSSPMIFTHTTSPEPNSCPGGGHSSCHHSPNEDAKRQGRGLAGERPGSPRLQGLCSAAPSSVLLPGGHPSPLLHSAPQSLNYLFLQASAQP